MKENNQTVKIYFNRCIKHMPYWVPNSLKTNYVLNNSTAKTFSIMILSLHVVFGDGIVNVLQ